MNFELPEAEKVSLSEYFINFYSIVVIKVYLMVKSNHFKTSENLGINHRDHLLLALDSTSHDDLFRQLAATKFASKPALSRLAEKMSQISGQNDKFSRDPS